MTKNSVTGKHWLTKYTNQISDVKASRPVQKWVSDFTYIKTDEGNCYLNLVPVGVTALQNTWILSSWVKLMRWHKNKETIRAIP